MDSIEYNERQLDDFAFAIRVERVTAIAKKAQEFWDILEKEILELAMRGQPNG